MWGFQTQVLMLVCQALYCRGSSFQRRPGFHYQTYRCCIYPVIIDSVLLLIFKHVNSLNQNVSLSCCSPHSLFVKLKAGLAIWRWFPLQGVSVSLEASISHTTFWVMQMHASCLSHLKSILYLFLPHILHTVPQIAAPQETKPRTLCSPLMMKCRFPIEPNQPSFQKVDKGDT